MKNPFGNDKMFDVEKERLLIEFCHSSGIIDIKYKYIITFTLLAILEWIILSSKTKVQK